MVSALCGEGKYVTHTGDHLFPPIVKVLTTIIYVAIWSLAMDISSSFFPAARDSAAAKVEASAAPEDLAAAVGLEASAAVGLEASAAMGLAEASGKALEEALPLLKCLPQGHRPVKIVCNLMTMVVKAGRPTPTQV